MDTKEANNIIAEYMGWSTDHASTRYIYHSKDFSYHIDKEPSESLDALVPVWEKMAGTFHVAFSRRVSPIRDLPPMYSISLNAQQGMQEPSSGVSLQEAMAVATAKAIKKLGE